jgi:exosortase
MSSGVGSATTGRIAEYSLRPSAIGYAAILCATLAVWPAALSLADFWNGILDYEHGWMIAATCVVWLFLRRAQLDSQAIRPSAWAVVALAGVLLLWLLAYRGSNQMGEQLLLPAALWLAVAAAAGAGAARLTAAPLAFLYFAVPVWEYLLPYLQRMTVVVSEFGLALLGIQAHVVGDRVTIPEGTFEIAEGCAGKRYLLVALALAGLVGAVNRLRLRRQMLFFAVCGFLALLANWIRVMVVIDAGHRSAMQHYLVSVEHQTFGFEVFTILTVLIVLLGRWWAPADSLRPTLPTLSSVQWQPLSASVCAPFVLMGAFIFLLSVLPGTAPTGPVRVAGMPVLLERWSGPLPAGGGWQPFFPGAEDSVRVAYASSAGTVEVYVNVYAEQRPGRTLAYYQNSILTPYDWEPVDPRGLWRSALESFRAAPLTMTAKTHSGERWVIAYGYAVGGHLSSSALFAELYYGALTLSGPSGSGVVGVGARCGESCDAARGLVLDFWARHSSALAQAIPTRPGLTREPRS